MLSKEVEAFAIYELGNAKHFLACTFPLTSELLVHPYKLRCDQFRRIIERYIFWQMSDERPVALDRNTDRLAPRASLHCKYELIDVDRFAHDVNTARFALATPMQSEEIASKSPNSKMLLLSSCWKIQRRASSWLTALSQNPETPLSSRKC